MRLLAAAAVALALAAPAAACTQHASQGRLETLLVCPSCHTTLDQSDSEVAREMKAEVKQRIAACQSEQQILDAMVDEFGPTILSTPQTHGFDLLAWILPLGGAAAARSHSRSAPARGRGRAPSRVSPCRPGSTGGRAARRRGAGSGSMTEKLPIAFLAGLVSVITPCVLPLVPGYLSAISAVEVEPARRARRQPPHRHGEHAVHRRLHDVFVCSARARRRSASTVDKRRRLKIAGFVLVVIGLAFIGLLPWPERAVAPGLLQRARGAGSAPCSAARSRSARRRASAPCSPRSSCSRGERHGRARRRAPGRLLARARRRVRLAGVAFAHAMRAFRWVRDHYQRVRVASGVDARRARGCCCSSTATGGCASRSTRCSRDRPRHV